MHLKSDPSLRRYWLRDGSGVTIRRAYEADEPALARMLSAASARALSQRFFGVTDPFCAARRLAMLAPGDCTLVAETDRGALVAHGALHPVIDALAEVAFIVRDDWQGRGVASLLLSHLAEAAAGAQIGTLVASILPGNAAMMSVFEQSGLPVELVPGADILQVRIMTAREPQLALVA